MVLLIFNLLEIFLPLLYIKVVGFFSFSISLIIFSGISPTIFSNKNKFDTRVINSFIESFGNHRIEFACSSSIELNPSDLPNQTKAIVLDYL